MVYIGIYTKIALKQKRAADKSDNVTNSAIDGNITVDLVEFSVLFI